MSAKKPAAGSPHVVSVAGKMYVSKSARKKVAIAHPAKASPSQPGKKAAVKRATALARPTTTILNTPLKPRHRSAQELMAAAQSVK